MKPKLLEPLQPISGCHRINSFALAYSENEAWARDDHRRSGQPVEPDADTAQVPVSGREEKVCSDSEVLSAVGLTAEFEKKFPGGPLIKVSLGGSNDVRSPTVLFGPSGSGKSTTLRCLAGLERPDRGIIRLGDEVWFDSARRIFLPPQRRQIGYLFQDYALFPHLRVAQNVAYGLAKIARPQR